MAVFPSPHDVMSILVQVLRHDFFFFFLVSNLSFICSTLLNLISFCGVREENRLQDLVAMCPFCGNLVSLDGEECKDF